MEENITGGVSPLQWKGRRGKSSGKGRRGTGDTRYKRDKWQKPASGGTTTLTPKRKAGELPPPPQKPYKIVDGKVEPNIYNTYNYGDNTINQSNNPGSKTTTTTNPGTPGTDDVYGTRKVTKTKDYSKEWKGPKSKEYPDGMPYDVWIKRPGNRQKEKDFVKSQQYEVDEKYLISKGTDPIPASSETITEVLPGSGNNTQNATIKQIINGEEVETSATPMLGSPGKYRLGGYRAMKKNRK